MNKDEAALGCHLDLCLTAEDAEVAETCSSSPRPPRPLRFDSLSLGDLGDLCGSITRHYPVTTTLPCILGSGRRDGRSCTSRRLSYPFHTVAGRRRRCRWQRHARLLGLAEQRRTSDGERFRDAATQRPDRRCTGPRHASEKATSIESVVAVINGDVVAAGWAGVAFFVEPATVAIRMLRHDRNRLATPGYPGRRSCRRDRFVQPSRGCPGRRRALGSDDRHRERGAPAARPARHRRHAA